MNKRTMIAIFLISVVIGAGIVIQSNITDGQNLYVSAKSIDDYKALIAAEKESIKKIEKKTAELESILDEYEKNDAYEQKEITRANLQKEVEEYAILSGTADVKGPGVRIVVDDGTRNLHEGESLNDIIVHDADILMIINELKKCNAEAITVNGQRITNTTAVNCSGYTIRINGITYARPFVIEAVGNGKNMVSTLIGKYGYGTMLKSYGVQFSIEYKDELVIKGGNPQENYIYMNSVKGEEKN